MGRLTRPRPPLAPMFSHLLSPYTHPSASVACVGQHSVTRKRYHSHHPSPVLSPLAPVLRLPWTSPLGASIPDPRSLDYLSSAERAQRYFADLAASPVMSPSSPLIVPDLWRMLVRLYFVRVHRTWQKRWSWDRHDVVVGKYRMTWIMTEVRDLMRRRSRLLGVGG